MRLGGLPITRLFLDKFPEHLPTRNWRILKFWSKFLEFFVEFLEFFVKLLEFFLENLEFSSKIIKFHEFRYNIYP